VLAGGVREPVAWSSTANASGVPMRTSAAAAADRRSAVRHGAHHSPL